LELRKLDPSTSMPWPAAALAGESAAITGGPPGVAGVAVDVVVLDFAALPLWPFVAGRCAAGWCVAGVVPACAAVVGVAAGGAAPCCPPPPAVTARAMPAPTTSTAAMATETVSQCSRRADSSRSPGGPGGPAHGGAGRAEGLGGVGGSSAGGATETGCVSCSILRATVTSPVRSRARRTASSMAPSARWLGVPGGRSPVVLSDIRASVRIFAPFGADVFAPRVAGAVPSGRRRVVAASGISCDSGPCRPATNL